MKPGTLYGSFTAKNGKSVTLRALRWEDLDDCLTFANALAREHTEDPNFGTLLDREHSRDEEARWLAELLLQIEKGDAISVVAEADGRLVGNSEVTRGRSGDVALYGGLGIAISREYRGIGVGQAMMKTLLDLCRSAGLKTVELRCLATNDRAIRLYEKVGFERVGIIRQKIRRRHGAIDELIMAISL